MTMDWKLWVKKIVSAAIGGAANSICVMAIDPLQFNFNEGLPKLSAVAFVSAVISVAMYLKQSPIPPACPEPEKKRKK